MRLVSPLVPALAALFLAGAAPAAAAPDADGFVPVPLAALSGKLETQAPHAFGPNGLELAVDGNVSVAFPLLAQALELDVEASGPVSLTWAARTQGRPFRPFGPPWRHVTLPRERRTLLLDLRIADGWTSAAQPVVGLTGAGAVIVHRLRVLPVPQDPVRLAEAYDAAQRWAPESLGHSTINFVTPPFWAASRGTWLADVVALVAAATFAAVLGVAWLRRRRVALARALAAAALVATGLWNAHLLVRFLPIFALTPTLDPEERIRDHYDVAPDVGALAALARATLRPGERVGVLAAPGNWFAPQTLCFNLAPRPCVRMAAGEPQREYLGISGVGRLRPDELDAIVVYRAPPPEGGFVPIASLGKSLQILRRR